MSYSNQLRAVRAHFGLSQPALAPWLGLSRNLLASVETGREQLPAHARPWLRPLVAALDLPDTDLPEPMASAEEAAEMPAQAAGPAPIRTRLAECYYQAYRLRQQQTALLARHRYAHRRRAAGFLLWAALPVAEDADIARRQRWLTRLLEAANDALAPAAPDGPVAVVLLDARRCGWLREAACLRAYLADPNGPQPFPD